jgi:hypothetical protein
VLHKFDSRCCWCYKVRWLLKGNLCNSPLEHFSLVARVSLVYERMEQAISKQPLVTEGQELVNTWAPHISAVTTLRHVLPGATKPWLPRNPACSFNTGFLPPITRYRKITSHINYGDSNHCLSICFFEGIQFNPKYFSIFLKIFPTSSKLHIRMILHLWHLHGKMCLDAISEIFVTELLKPEQYQNHIFNRHQYSA